jgi:hypothetical protein
MNVTLAAAAALLALWAVLVFGSHIGTGAVHILYAAAAILFARRVIVGAPKFLS